MKFVSFPKLFHHENKNTNKIQIVFQNTESINQYCNTKQGTQKCPQKQEASY